VEALKYRGGFYKAYGPHGPKKYVPSAEQRAKDERVKEKLNHLTNADLRKFDRALGRAFKPQTSQKSG
jgi:hypothetical protein